MPKQKADKPQKVVPATAASTGQDAELLKAQQKAEKARRKAEYEATRAGQVAAEKAERDKLKNKKGEPKVQTANEGQGQQSTGSSDVKTTASKTDVPKPQQQQQQQQQRTAEKKVASSTENTVGSAIISIKNLDINSTAADGNKGNKKSSTATNPPKTSTATAKRGVTTSQSRVQTLFDHLPKGVDPRRLFEEPGIKIKGIDSAFITLGLMYSHGQIHGSNNRVISLLSVVRTFIDSYMTPAEKDFKYEFPLSLKKNLEFLRKCRPFAVAMNNTVDFINCKLRDIEVEDGKTEQEIKMDLSEALQEFGEERIEKATDAIVAKATAKIVKDDIVLVFGSSDLVRAVIIEASKHTSFSLVVVDGRPYATERRAKGLDIMARLDNVLIRHVKYTSITGLSNVIRSVPKVILGAHGLLTNGGVLAHAGTSQIALMASANNIPVLVCCETLKFCDKSPTDSFFLNEIGTGFGLSKKITESVVTAECEPYLVTPVIKYDVTPPELVTAVITDVDILPCTSVPVVLRVQENRTTRSTLYHPHANRI